jgi:hypothetical protein
MFWGKGTHESGFQDGHLGCETKRNGQAKNADTENDDAGTFRTFRIIHEQYLTFPRNDQMRMSKADAFLAVSAHFATG